MAAFHRDISLDEFLLVAVNRPTAEADKRFPQILPPYDHPILRRMGAGPSILPQKEGTDPLHEAERAAQTQTDLRDPALLPRRQSLQLPAHPFP